MNSSRPNQWKTKVRKKSRLIVLMKITLRSLIKITKMIIIKMEEKVIMVVIAKTTHRNTQMIRFTTVRGGQVKLDHRLS